MGTGWKGLGRASAPDLSLDPNPAILSPPVKGLAFGTEQRFLAGNDKSLARPKQHREHQQKETSAHDDGSGQDRGGELEPGGSRRKHHDGTDHERDNAGDANDSKGADMGLGDH